jgi:ERCC4-related helicase
MIGLTGPILVDVPSVYLRRTIDPNTSRTYLPDPTIVMIPCPREKKTYGYREHHTGRYVNTSDWRTVEKECIIENPYRMELIRRLCYWKCQEDVRILILVARHNHGILIHKALDKIKVPSVCSFGGDVIREMQGDDLTWKHDADETTLKEFNSGKYKVLIGSPKFDEGQSLGVITDLIMCGAGRGGKSQRRLFQRIGRALHSKVEPRVYDFMDSSHYMVLAQSNARLRAFERDQYKVEVRIPDECMKIIPGG